ncbi:hypothetical protein RYR54_004010 [Aeromonas sobria]|nr:hypothetical protein [Aeromonas sobria]
MANIDYELLKIKVDVWKTVVGTQQHFNDLEMRIRNYGILILSAFIGAIGVTFKSGYELPYFNIPASSILSFAAAFIWLLFFFMDVYWYHPLLKGAVAHGKLIEDNINADLGGIVGLASTVSNNSSVDVFCFKNMHSTGKAKLFYLSVFSILLASAIALFFVDKP